MHVASREFVIKKLSELMVNPRKKYSQNFLTDFDIACQAAKSLPSNLIIEIGPGLGALSEAILQSNKNLIAYEIDDTMVSHLRNHFSFYKNFKVINTDFLKSSFEYQEKISVISNLPYSLTTPIIEKVLLSNNDIDVFIFMVQKEVYSRITAKKGNKDYGPLNILIEYLGAIKPLVKVNKDKFLPSPNVDSIILTFTSNNNFLNKNKQNFYKFLNGIFAMRRKTLLNNLTNYLKSKEKAINSLNKASIDSSLRAEALSLNELLTLFNDLII